MTSSTPPGLHAGNSVEPYVVDTTHQAEVDPPGPWERPATPEEIQDRDARHFERLPHRPASLAAVPEGALEALRDAVGEIGLTQLFVIPATVRGVGTTRDAWVATRTEVLAVGADTIAVWIDDPDGPGVRATLPFASVAGILDRNILLYGRLEIIGPGESIVVRYNAVGRPELRDLLRAVRRSSPDVGPPLPSHVGVEPADLPHKWMGVARSPDLRPHGNEPLLLAAGDLHDPEPRLYNGLAALSPHELLVATDPTPDLMLPQYGVDIVAVPRARATSMAAGESELRIGVAADDRPVEIRISADPSLVAAAMATIAPVLRAG